MLARRPVLRLAIAAVAAAAFPRRARADAPPGAALAAPPVALPEATRKALETASLIYVATRRKNGERSSVKPIWFLYENGEIFFTTSPDSWKAKRIERGSPLYIWVGDDDGPFVVGTAEPLTDPAVIAHMGEEYSKKYWIAWVGFFRPRPERVAEGKTVAYRVALAEGTPPPSGE